MKNIYLSVMGTMGSGKTTVAQLLGLSTPEVKEIRTSGVRQLARTHQNHEYI